MNRVMTLAVAAGVLALLWSDGRAAEPLEAELKAALEKYALPGGIEMIGHSGGTAGYRSGVFHFPALDLTMTFAMNVNDNPLPVVMAGLRVMGEQAVK
jgi:hypothetical protein